MTHSIQDRALSGAPGDDGSGSRKVNPGSPICGEPILIANALTAGTYTVAVDGTGLRGYYIHYQTLVGNTTMQFYTRAVAEAGYVGFTVLKTLTPAANGISFAVPDNWFALSGQVPLPPDCQVTIVVAAGATCTAWLIPIPA